MCVCVCQRLPLPRGLLAAAVVAVRVDAVVRADVMVLLAAVDAVPFLVAAVEPAGAAVLALGTRGRLSGVIWRGTTEQKIDTGDVR